MLALGLFAPGCFAQTLPFSDVDRQRDAVEKERQQQRILREIELQKQLSRQKDQEAAKPAVVPGLPGALKGEAFVVDEIRILNDDITDVRSLPLLERLKHQRLGSAEIFNLIKALTDYYAGLGYVTTLVTVGPQNLRGGVLELTVQWGYIEGFLVDGKPPTGGHARMLAGAAPGIAGRILNVKDIDQIVENLNTAAKTAKIDIVAAERPGWSYLNVHFQERSKISLSGSFDNSNQYEKNAHSKANAQISLSDLLSLNETLTLGWGESQYADSHDDRQYNWFASYAMPLGPFGLNINLSQYNSAHALYGIAGRYENKSVSDEAKVRLSYVLARDQVSKTSTWIEVNSKDSKNYFENILIGVSSQRTSTASLGLSRTAQLWGGYAYVDLTWTRGVDWFGATRGATGTLEPPFRFDKFNSQFSWDRAVPVLGQNLQYTLKWSGQYSADRLLATNQISLGDEYTVRGFIAGPLRGDIGTYVSNTVRLPIACTACGSWLRTVTPLFGLDIGTAKSQGSKSWSTISGAALGLRADGEYGGFSLVFGQPLRKLAGVESKPVTYLSAEWRF